MSNIITYFLDFFKRKIIAVSSDNFPVTNPIVGIHFYNYNLSHFFIKNDFIFTILYKKKLEYKEYE